jgi:hypothetical protein
MEMTVAAAMLGMIVVVAVQFTGAYSVQRREFQNRQQAILEVGNVVERMTRRAWDQVTAEEAKKEGLSASAKQTLPDAELTVVVDPIAKSGVATKGPPAEKATDAKNAPKTPPTTPKTSPDAKSANTPAAGTTPIAEIEAKRIVVRLRWRNAAGQMGKPIQVVAWKYRRARS